MAYRFYDKSSNLHDTHLEGVSGSHWGEEQLRDFRVSYEVVKPGDAYLPLLDKHRLDELKHLLKYNAGYQNAEGERFDRLRDFAHMVRGDFSSNPSRHHPMEFLRQGRPGAQFYHDLAVACLRNPSYSLQDPETPEKRGPSMRSVNPPMRLQEFVTNFDDFSPLSAEVNRAAEEASQTASFRPATVTDSAEFDDLHALSKPETVTQALAKSFIETVIALGPFDPDEVADLDLNPRLSFFVSQNTFRLNLPSVHCTVVNDGGVVFTRHTSLRHGSDRKSNYNNYNFDRVLLSLEAKAKQRQPRPISGISMPTADKAILAQQCAELIGQALSDPELDTLSQPKTYYLISLSGCAITFISATFTSQYVAYLKSSCNSCRERSAAPTTRPHADNHQRHQEQSQATSNTTRTRVIDNAINPPNLYLQGGQTTPEQAPTPYPIGSSSPVMASSPAAEYATRHPSTTVAPSTVKRSHSNLTDDEGETDGSDSSSTRRTREFAIDNDNRPSFGPDVFLEVVRSREFLLTNTSGRVDAIVHLVALLELLEEETDCVF